MPVSRKRTSIRMVTCTSYLDIKTLYRGQVSDHGVILSSGWRKLWKARTSLSGHLSSLLLSYVNNRMEETEFERRLVSLCSTLEDGPTFYRFLGEPAGMQAVKLLVNHIREAVGEKWRDQLTVGQLYEMEGVFLIYYQSYLFGNAESLFFRRYIPRTFTELLTSVLRFYNDNRNQFDINFRIRQVVPDIMGVLQHYGVLGTPGIDLTDDLEVALWFATHKLEREKSGAMRYERLAPDRWGYVFEVRAPTVIFSTLKLPRREIDELPDRFVVNLSSLSPLFLRIQRQKGWYGTLEKAWELMLDFQKVFRIEKRRVGEYASAEVIAQRLESKGLSQSFLFPPETEDPFKAFLKAEGVEAFM